MDFIHKNQTWKLVDFLDGKIPIIFKWVYKTKNSANLKVEKLETQLIA
jgi:hypothetical protein